MIGAIAGDVIGSAFEFDPIKKKEFPLFSGCSSYTDDSVLTIAIAHALLGERQYAQSLWDLGGEFPNAGYGASFIEWLRSLDPKPYNSWGNGAAMRVSPIGWACNSIDEVLEQASISASVSHNHPEGIKGAQAVALAVFLARTATSKKDIKMELINRFNYDLDRSIDSIRPDYEFEVSCQLSVPESIIAFIEADSFEDSVRNAISLRGDSDTMACIAGSIAEAFYGSVPSTIESRVRNIIPTKLLKIVDQFTDKFCQK